MNRTKIEWCDYTWNPISGCKNGCFYCYGRQFRQRFNKDIQWETLLENKAEWQAPLKLKNPSKIFVGSMTDMWAGWMPFYYKKRIMEIIAQCPQHTFFLLTKNPFGYSGEDMYFIDFPNNCWLGITITQDHEAIKTAGLCKFKNTFVSCEPLLEEITSSYFYLTTWIIIGAMTGRYSKNYQPKKEWIKGILKQTNKLKIPIFLKNNLQWKEKIQEFPATLTQRIGGER